MSNSSGSSSSKSSGLDRFYSAPALRKNQQQKRLESDSAEPDWSTGSDEPALSNAAYRSNLDRLLAAFTPSVTAQLSCEPRMKGRRTGESSTGSTFVLEDLWETYREWSAYGVEVPVIIVDGDGEEAAKMYYVPSLSAIQLYASRRVGDSGAESSKETSRAGITDSEADKQARGDLMNTNSQRLSRLTLRERTTSSSSSDETAEVYNSPGQLVYEYYEGAQPHFRPPFHDKISILASEYPALKNYRSCDISPSSWFSVAWYPIYKIPVVSSLRRVDASFLTFHTLSTQSRRKNQPQSHASSGKKVHGVDGSLNISLPPFALASYKLRGSILTPNRDSERQKMESLLQAATDWLQNLQVQHPDFLYFVSHSFQQR